MRKSFIFWDEFISRRKRFDKRMSGPEFILAPNVLVLVMSLDLGQKISEIQYYPR